MEIVLISPYELGRQPFGLAEPAAWLKESGHAVLCIDLSIEKLEPSRLKNAKLVAILLSMHTATRIALDAIPRIRALAPKAHLCAYGLYAPMNAQLLQSLGVHTILGGEAEPALRTLADELAAGRARAAQGPLVHLGKIPFLVPDRTNLPPLERYAKLVLPDGKTRTVGFTEASRGCKHLCRHCPVVPVYEGRFRVVPIDVVMSDIRNQIRSGAEHISFGDPDFFNGPTHAMRLAAAFAAEFPNHSFDATIKIEHLIKHAKHLPALKDAGLIFVTSAVEAVDDDILRRLAKNHTSKDFETAVEIMREVDIALAPTFVTFTPWTTLEGYLELLRYLVRLRLVESVPPIQLAIRLLVPAGSHLLELPGFRAELDAFDPALLGYPWRHRDHRVDALQLKVMQSVTLAEEGKLTRRDVFSTIWGMAHDALGVTAGPLPHDLGTPIPHHSEPWYCCAEPTEQQLQAF